MPVTTTSYPAGSMITLRHGLGLRYPDISFLAALTDFLVSRTFCSES
jgi:hypothetical protein